MVRYFPTADGANRLPISNLAPLDESVKMTFMPPSGSYARAVFNAIRNSRSLR